MKKAIITIIAAALTAGVASAADVSVGVDFASAYVFRGVTFNDGLVAQPYGEISGFPIPEEYGSLAIGTWANFDIGDYGNTLEKNEFSEIDYYLSYTLPITALDVSVGYTEYTFPNGGSADREVECVADRYRLIADCRQNRCAVGGGSAIFNQNVIDIHITGTAF